jgi:hypothetical protein
VRGIRGLLVGGVALAAALAGCGGGGGHATSTTTPTRSQPARAPAPAPLRGPRTRAANPAAVRVIRAWVDAERRSDTARASRYFALPALVANGGQPLVLRTRAAVRLWNASLPCGARLVETAAFRGFTIARFRLTQRPGQRCDALGVTASTAFRLRRGLIAQWVRVDDRHPYRGAPAPSPSPTQAAGGSA